MADSTLPAADTALIPARTRLADAISALIDRKPHQTDQGTIWLNPLYTQLRQALTENHNSARAHQHATLPCSVDILDLLALIDRAVIGWEPPWPLSDDDEYPTILRLRIVDARKWRPQDTDRVNSMAGEVESWVAKIRALFEPAPKTVPAPCPACGKQTIYRDVGGEKVRQTALQLTTQGCRCQACHTVWTPDYFTHLARVLGCETPAGVLE